MNRIKKFESFGHRMPKKLSYLDVEKKREVQGTEPFEKKEIEFFKKLEKENSESIYDIDLGIHDCFIQIYPIGESDDLININITKLKDDWYLIQDFFEEFEPDCFICDEWDEVLGYLGNKTNLSF